MSTVDIELNDTTIRRRIGEFRWYQPVPLGHGVYAHAHDRPHLSRSYENGITKWRYIVQRNLPDVQGMRVLDIGCNAGLFSIEMARCGAREVVGVDSEETWPGWQRQSQFVKEALEWRCQTTYNVRFVDCPMPRIPDAELGRFDLAMALCSLYYIPREDMLRVLSHLRQNGCQCIVLQANKGRMTDSPESAHRSRPGFLKTLLKEAGYPYVTLDAPLFYKRPVLVGHLQAPKLPPMTKRNRIRHWLHRLF